MVLQKRLEYGFNGYQVPPTPRAPRSARKRVSSWKKNEDKNRMCAFDLLATVAGNLLLEADNSGDKLSQEETRVVNDSTIKTEEDSSKANVCDQGSCNKSFFVSEIISKAPVTDTCSGPASGITVSDCSEKVPSVLRSVNGIPDSPVENVGLPFSCKIGDINNKEMANEAPNNGKPPPLVNNVDNNVNLVIRDDDEKSSGCTQPHTLNNKTFRPPSRIGDRRIRRLSASKQWKVAPKLNDGVHFNTDSESNPVCHSKKTCFKHQRSLRDYPFKKRRLYQLDNPSNSGSPRKGSVEDGSSLGGADMVSSEFAAQDAAFQAQDSHVKLKIKSFRVPEFFIEIPETATVSSLKRTVMEAVTAIFSGELHVGVMLQGKRLRDDNKTLLQTGICHDDKLDALGFTLEPNQLPSSLCPDGQSLVPPPKPLTRYAPPQTVANQMVIQREVSDSLLHSPMRHSRNTIESDHDSAPSPPDMSVDNTRALVTVPGMNPGALDVVPTRKSKRAEVAQRRIRRPFSVSEVEALVEAVEKLGTGRWRDVKLRAFDDAKHRTYVDLKDKWKTLVHTARISPQQRRGEPVPQELLDRVLEAHGYWSHHQPKNQFKQTEICRLV